jgi:hypothetical protein
MSAAADLITAIESATGKPGKRAGKNTRLLCPCHDDHNASLDIAEATDGSPLVICRSCGAGLPEVAASLGRPTHEFLSPNGDGDLFEEWTPRGAAIATYRYVDADGRLLYEVCRTADKQFPQRRPDPSSKTGWRWNLGDTPRVLYHLPQLIAAIASDLDIWIAEGEKDVHALERVGVAATCNPGGAEKWRDLYSEALRGCHHITIVADNDDSGSRHAAQVVASLKLTLADQLPQIRIVHALAGKDAADHLSAGHTIDEFALVDDISPPVVAVRLAEFLALEFATKPAILGTELDTIIPTGGLALIAGMPGAGKTTLAIDCAFHLASGRDWLGIPAARPINILFVENEGPQHKFQDKLRRKTELWEHDLIADIHIHVLNWGAFNFTSENDVALIRSYLDEHMIDLVIGDPLDTLGPRGVGSPDDTREFVALLPPLGLTNNRSFVFLHHFRKEISISEINQVSGAWGGRLDTLLVLKETEQPNELRLSFAKLRWAEPRQPLILGKLINQAAFEVLAEEQPQTDDSAVEAMLRRIIDTLQRTSGIMERPALAMRCETSPGDRTYQRALRVGLDRDLLAKDQKGRKTSYSLTEASWFVPS